MAGAPLEPTRYPGIYRRGDKFAFEWSDATGRRRRGTAASLSDARAAKGEREVEAAMGSLGDVGTRSRKSVASYAREMFGADLERSEGKKPERGRYQGRRSAIRDSTLADYRRDLERFILPTLGERPLGKVTPPDISKLAAELAARNGKGQGGYLADATLHRIFVPVGAMFAQAVQEGLILHNPTRDVQLPRGRDAIRKFNMDEPADPDAPAPGQVRAMSRKQLAAFLLVVQPKWRPFFHLLAATGLRVSEAIALRWSDVRLDGSSPSLRVSRAFVRGKYGPPKTRHGNRDVPLSHELVRELRKHKMVSEWSGDDDLIFAARNGKPIRQENLRRRVLNVAREEANVSWIGFHAFRHTCASMLIADGRNIVQVSRWLGHHSPSLTLNVYAHLMDDGVGEPLSLGSGQGSGSGVRHSSAQLGDTSDQARLREASNRAEA